MINKGNNVAFIDGQNLYLGIKSSGLLIDYFLFRKYLSMKYGVKHAFLYIGFIKENKELYKDLENAGFELIFKKVLKTKNKVKGNIDVLMATDAMDRLCKNEFDKAIVITSDGDFAPLIQKLKEKGKFKLLISPKEDTCSSLLKEEAGEKVRYLTSVVHKMKRHSADT